MFRYIVVITGVVALLVIAITAGGGAAPASSDLKVIDGDTFIYEGETIRMIGIDTPETVDPHAPVECGGPEAHDRLTDILTHASNIVVLPGKERTDDYGRTLAYVYADDEFVNATMARDGMARYYDFEPNTRYAPLFHKLVYDAIRNHRGLWGACPDAMNWATGGS